MPSKKVALASIALVIVLVLGIGYMYSQQAISEAIRKVGSQVQIKVLKANAVIIEDRLSLKVDVLIINESPYDIHVKNVYALLDGTKIEIEAGKGYTILAHSNSTVYFIVEIPDETLSDILNALLASKSVTFKVVGEAEGTATALGVIPIHVTSSFTKDVTITKDVTTLPEIVNISNFTFTEDNKLYVSLLVRNPYDFEINVMEGKFNLYSGGKLVAKGDVLPTVLPPRYVAPVTLNITEAYDPTAILETASVTAQANMTFQIYGAIIHVSMEKSMEVKLNLGISNLSGRAIEISKVDDYHAIARVRVYGNLTCDLINIREFPVINATFDILVNETVVAKGELLNSSTLTVERGAIEGEVSILISTNETIDSVIASLVGKSFTIGIRNLVVNINFLGKELRQVFPSLIPIFNANTTWAIESYSIVTPPITDPSQIPDWIKFVVKIRIYNGMNFRIRINRINGTARDPRNVIISNFDFVNVAVIKPNSENVITLEVTLNKSMVEYIKNRYQTGKTLSMTVYITATISGYVSNLPFTITLREIPLAIYISNLPYDP